jgi:hypothetical protein
MSQRRTTMLEAAKEFKVVGADSMTDQRLDLLLGEKVCNWMRECYQTLTGTQKISFHLGYIYAYPIRGQANPAVKAIIELTKAPMGDAMLDKRLEELRKTALKWNGKKRSAFGDYINTFEAYNKSNKENVHLKMIYYLSAWEPYAVLNIGGLD